MAARKPCKQCGGPGVLQKGGGVKKGWVYIRCKDYNCFSDYGGGISGLKFHQTKEEAEAAWNKQQDA